MFGREHHRRIAALLDSLDADLLRDCHCWFGGGTAMALRFGEYRESLDVDFIVSDVEGYRTLRQLLGGPGGLDLLLRKGARPLRLLRELRSDQYGIRTLLEVNGAPIKLEIVREGRIELDLPKRADSVCGIATLTAKDMLALKLLANSDRGLDDSTFNRDVIDIAMLRPRLPQLRAAVCKAEGAYGSVVLADLSKSLVRLQQRDGWLDRCMQSMRIELPRALVWQRLRSVARVCGSHYAG